MSLLRFKLPSIPWKRLIAESALLELHVNLMLAFSLPNLRRFDVLLVNGWDWGQAMGCGLGGFWQLIAAYGTHLRQQTKGKNLIFMIQGRVSQYVAEDYRSSQRIAALTK